MLNPDYLIVGQGVAGSCFALKLLREGFSFVIIDENKDKASSVAVGIYNPVVLKRFSLIWNAQIQLDWMHEYFSEFGKLLGQNYIDEFPTRRIIKDENEIHAWNKKANHPDLTDFLDQEIQPLHHPDFDTPLGYGEVKQTGRIDLGKCLNDFRNHLIEMRLYENENFDHSELIISDSEIQYKEFKAKKVVFCEGFGVTENPFFNYIPVIGVKGEVLKIKTENQIPKAIWKAHNFLMPIDKKICVTASTYDRDDLAPDPTEKGKEEMIQHLRSFYKGNFEILEQTAGIRPTIIDRRPVVGTHPIHENVLILNGMGTRGTLLGPAMAEELFNFTEKKQPIDKEADVLRFTKKYFQNV
ncbi:NAD(P)/FAD-dependent oxidoreductase [Moheibacter sediminis]|uniref:Glycine/D-amino acid oxidase n=1 Tax=Moheibacter sediminis TaxID=1434700 RepID=A0A1W1Y994_9FLAO|nr:FAD-dependent oxidoreductase [Moheibacter sediminis]SMC32401.1 Glycine/D-amino acid oxidase [Moheibacter sediminis]